MLLQAAEHAARDLPGGYGVALVQTLLALAAVCVLAWTVLRWSAGRGLGQRGGRIEILERAHLEPRRSLYLVKIGARTFLLGAGESGPPSMIAELSEGELPPAKPGVTFADVLQRVKKPYEPAQPTAAEPDEERDAQ